jgi:hypothetical protein
MKIWLPAACEIVEILSVHEIQAVSCVYVGDMKKKITIMSDQREMNT